MCATLLGIDIDNGHVPSQDILKAAYHKALLRDHPDKGGSQESFLCMRGAFDAVKDYIDNDGKLTSIGERAVKIGCEHPYISCVLNMFALDCLLNVHMRTGCAPTLYVPLQVTLEDVYCRRIKKIVVTACRRVVQTSEHNAGKNTIRENDLDSLDACEDACEDDDISWTYHRVVLYVPLDADAISESVYTFHGMGHDSFFAPSEGRGDIMVELSVAPHDVFEIDEVINTSDLHASINVSIRDYYYGRRIVLPALDGDSANDIVVDYIGNRDQRVNLFRGMGLPRRSQTGDSEERGDIYVFCNVSLPEIPATTLQKMHVRLFFEMLFGMF